VTDQYRYTGTLFKRSPLVSPTGEGFAAKVRAIVADHAGQLQGMLSQAKRGQGLYRNGMAGKKRTWLPGGILVETWINPFGLVPTIMARVTYPKGGRQKFETLFQMENGWLNKRLEGDPLAPVYRVYVWDEIINTAPGVALIYEFVEGDECASTVDALSTVMVPELDENNGYVSTIEDRTDPILYTEYEPQLYSGLARLFMQAKRGANKKFIDEFPSPYSSYIGSGPTIFGIIRSPQNTYYAVNTSVHGVFAVKLALDAKHTCLSHADSGSGGQGGMLRDIAEAVILANLTPTGDVITLLEDDDPGLQEAYWWDGWNLDAIAWGWCWRWQRRGMPDEHISEAVRVGYYKTGLGTAYRVYSRLCRLTFTWGTDLNGSETLDSATITNEQEWEFVPSSAYRLCVASTTQTTWVLINPPSWSGVLEEDGVILSWFTSDGAQQYLEYNGSAYAYNLPDLDQGDFEAAIYEVTACAGNTTSISQTASSSSTSPCWAIRGKTITAFESSSAENWAFSLEADITGAKTPLGFAYNPSQFAQCGGGQINGYFWNDGRPNVNVGWAQTGTVETVSTYSVVAKDAGVQHIVIGESVGVLWVVWHNGTTTQTNTANDTRVSTGRPMASGGLASNPDGTGGEVEGRVTYDGTANAYVPSDPETTETGGEATPLQAKAFIDVDEYVLSSDDALTIGYAATLSTVFLPVYDQGFSAYVSYAGASLAFGSTIPTGMSAYGSTTSGIFIGGV
jgi:hypothetical protein